MHKRLRLWYLLAIPMLLLSIMLVQPLVVHASDTDRFVEDPDSEGYCDGTDTNTTIVGSGGWSAGKQTNTRGMNTNYSDSDTYYDTSTLGDMGRNSNLPRTGIEDYAFIPLLIFVGAFVLALVFFIKGKKKASASILSLVLVSSLVTNTMLVNAAWGGFTVSPTTGTHTSTTMGQLSNFSGVVSRMGILVTFHQFDSEAGEGWMFNKNEDGTPVSDPLGGSYPFPYIAPIGSDSSSVQVGVRNHQDIVYGELLDEDYISRVTFETIRKDIDANGGAILWTDNVVNSNNYANPNSTARAYNYWAGKDADLAQAVSDYFRQGGNTSADRFNVFHQATLGFSGKPALPYFNFYNEYGASGYGSASKTLIDNIADKFSRGINHCNVIFNQVDNNGAYNKLHEYGIATSISSEDINGLIVVVPFLIQGVTEDATVSFVTSSLDCNGIQEIINSNLTALGGGTLWLNNQHIADENITAPGGEHFDWYQEHLVVPSTYGQPRRGVSTRPGYSSLFLTCSVMIGDKTSVANDDPSHYKMGETLGLWQANRALAAQMSSTPMGIGYYSGCLKGAPTPEPVEVDLTADLVLYDYNLNYVFNKGIASGTRTNIPIAMLPQTGTYYGTTVTCAGTHWVSDWRDDDGDGIKETDHGSNVAYHTNNKVTTYENWSYDVEVLKTDITSGVTMTAQSSGKKLIVDNSAFTDFGSWGSSWVKNMQNGAYTSCDTASYYEDNNGGTFTSSADLFSNSCASVDFSWTLSRAVFGDKRTISSLTNNTYSTYAQTTLGNDYGNKPVTILPATTERDSWSTFAGGDSTEKFKFSFRFDATDSTNAITGHNLVDHSTCGGVKHYNKGTETATSFISTATVDQLSDVSVTACTVTINELVFKYSAGTKPVGENPNSDMTVFNASIDKYTGYSTSNHYNNEYTIAFLYNTDNIVTFYPEVPMQLWYITDGHTATRNVINTIGEQMRSSKSSMIVGMRLVNIAGDGDVTGTVYSDTMQAGSATGGSSNALIYAGSDVSLTAKINSGIEMYGYALDLVNKDVDSTVYTGVGVQSNYASDKVIYDGSDVYSDWGNSGTTDALRDEFKSWATNMVSEKNLTAEVTLDVNGTGVDKTYEDMGASIARTGGITVNDGGAYQIVIANGNLVQNGGYTALIKQMATDFNISESEAKDMFFNSEIWFNIVNAIEHSGDSANMSQSQWYDGKVDATYNHIGGLIAEPNRLLGTASHWYDEQVKTFVIRRFNTNTVKFGTITVNDKIDYNSAPRSGQANAEWYLTLYINGNGEGCYPQNSFSSILTHGSGRTADEDNTVVLWRVHIENESSTKPASFYILKDTTNSTGH